MHNFKILMFLTIIFLLSSCSEGKKSFQEGALKLQQDNIELSPSYITKDSEIAVKVGGVDASSLSYQWIVNDMEIKGATGNVFRYDKLRKNDRVQVRVAIRGGEGITSEFLTVSNMIPQILSANLIPQSPKMGDELKVETKTLDGDSDRVSLSYEWFVNGQPVGGTSDTIKIDKTLTKKGDKISLKITPTDGQQKGQSITLYSIIANSPPNVLAGTQPTVSGSTYMSRIMAEDVDGDALTYTIVKGPKDMKIDAKSGVITWELKPEYQGRHEVLVSVNDGQGGEILVPLTTQIGVIPPK